MAKKKKKKKNKKNEKKKRGVGVGREAFLFFLPVPLVSSAQSRIFVVVVVGFLPRGYIYIKKKRSYGRVEKLRSVGFPETRKSPPP